MVVDQLITDDYALYNGDCIEVMKDMPDKSIDLSIYSPPFGGLYQYTSANEDLSNSLDYKQFFEHYNFVVSEISRLTKPGRMTCIHCMDVPKRSDKGYEDLPGDIIRQHRHYGFYYWARFCIWKEPLRVAIRTRSKGLMHKQIVKDTSLCGNAGADYLLIFKKVGKNETPIKNPTGLNKYCGERENPHSFNKYKDWKDPKTNKYAHWIWQQYASSFWDDIRINNVLPYKEARDSEEEKHIHPLQLDVIERCIIMWSNEGEKVLSPFAGVGSEIYGSLINKRKGIGIELKPSYYRQMVKNVGEAKNHKIVSSLIKD